MNQPAAIRGAIRGLGAATRATQPPPYGQCAGLAVVGATNEGGDVERVHQLTRTHAAGGRETTSFDLVRRATIPQATRIA